jgi:hypothetical protein
MHLYICKVRAVLRPAEAYQFLKETEPGTWHENAPGPVIVSPRTGIVTSLRKPLRNKDIRGLTIRGSTCQYSSTGQVGQALAEQGFTEPLTKIRTGLTILGHADPA